MAAPRPGELLKHALNGEEGKFLRPVIWCVGSNKGEGYLVDVGGTEKMWLETETIFIDPSTSKSSS